MNMRWWLFVSVMIFSSHVVHTAWASDARSMGQAAEQAGRLDEALTHYVAALEADTNDHRLRQTIITLVQRMQPQPSVPDAAKRHLARGRAAVKAATDEAGFRRAATEFQLAVAAAPWLAAGYYNLGVIQDKAGLHAEAIENLNFYLLAAPGAEDVAQVQDLIYEIEYRQEEAQRAPAVTTAATPAAPATPQLPDIEGDWYIMSPTVAGEWTEKIEIRIRNGKLEERILNLPFGQPTTPFPWDWGPFRHADFDGRIFKSWRVPGEGFLDTDSSHTNSNGVTFGPFILEVVDRYLMIHEAWIDGQYYRSEWRQDI